MAKSNVRAVRMRKVNRQLHIQDQLRQKAEREFSQQPVKRTIPATMRRSKVAALIRRINLAFRSWFNRKSGYLGSLDLRRDSNISRSAGAKWIRRTFGVPSAKFISTRDGKRV